MINANNIVSSSKNASLTFIVTSPQIVLAKKERNIFWQKNTQAYFLFRYFCVDHLSLSLEGDYHHFQKKHYCIADFLAFLSFPTFFQPISFFFFCVGPQWLAIKKHSANLKKEINIFLKVYCYVQKSIFCINKFNMNLFSFVLSCVFRFAIVDAIKTSLKIKIKKLSKFL